MNQNAYILHSFSRFHKNRCWIYLIGRLENGQTFGFVDNRFTPFFYIRENDSTQAQELVSKFSLQLKPTKRRCMDGASCLKVEHANKSLLDQVARSLRQHKIASYEADVKVHTQYLMEKELCSTCSISSTAKPGAAVDLIYFNGKLSPNKAKIPLKAIILECFFGENTLQAFAISSLEESSDLSPRMLAQNQDLTELELIQDLQKKLLEIDPDIICAWKVQDELFLPLQKVFQKYDLPFRLGRSRKNQWFLEKQYRGRELAVLQGRQLLDIQELMQHTWERYEESTPECIIEEVLHETVPDKSLSNTVRRCELLSRLVRHKNLIDLSLRRSLLTGLNLERCWGSIASFEYLYILELHKRNFVAPSLGIDQSLEGSHPGGLVMKPHAGIHKNIFVFDFKSLYPSIIRTFNIDPLAFAKAQGNSEKVSQNTFNDQSVVELPNGVYFHRDPGLLPQILKAFFKSREMAKNDQDELASFVCKILMNSFFGVLGTPGCRFAQGPIVSSVSQTSHYLLRWVRKFLEAKSFKVLYGDTDSLFVDLNIKEELSFQSAHKMGMQLHEEINQALSQHIEHTFKLKSYLDLEFEKFYPAFFQPSMRSKENKGRAKSYAALKATERGSELEIVGLEAVRRDWTELARTLQRELLQKIFDHESSDSIENHIKKVILELKTAKLDHQLIYRKSLTKPLASYTKTTPPHVKAARLLKTTPSVVFYVMTINGPQPRQDLNSCIDYDHYIEKQILPIVQTLAQHSNFSWQRAVLNQQELF